MNLKKITGMITLFLMLFACTELRSQLNLNLFKAEVLAGSDLVAKMSNGDLCVTGIRVDNGVEKAFISRCNSAGTPIWFKDLGIGGSSPRINDLIIDAAGNAGFCGSFGLGATQTAFVGRFDMSTQTFMLHKTWQSGATSAAKLIATASGKEYIVTGNWTTSTPGHGSTPSMFVASVDITSNSSGISWFKDIYESLRTTGVGLQGSFFPTALCEMKDGYGISYFRQYTNYTDAWTFLILKNGALASPPVGNTLFREVDINFNRTSTLGYAQGKIRAAIGDLNSNTATLFYVTESTAAPSGHLNAEEGIAAVLVTYSTTGPASVGDQTFLRLPGAATVGILRMRSLVYDNNEAYLAGSVGTSNHDAYLVHLNRNTFLFTNAYRLNYTTSQEEAMHICGTVSNLSCTYTSDGYGTTSKMLVGSLSLSNLGGTCEFSNDNFSDFDHNNLSTGTDQWFIQSASMSNGSPTVSLLTIPTAQRCEPCPEPERTTVDLNYCNTGGITGRWYQPCNTMAPGEKYVLSGNGYSYDSEIGYDDNGNHISGCIAHFLTPGTYQFTFTNDMGCVTKIVTVNVHELTPSLTISLTTNLSYCATPGTNGRWVTPCDLLTVPANFMYTLEDLATPPAFSPYNSDDWVDAHGGNGCIAHFLSDGSYRVRMYDKDNCTYTELIINITHTDPTTAGTTTFNLNYCAVPGKDGKWVNPCDYMGTLPSDFVYTFEGYNSDIGYDDGGTHIDGCIAFYMHDGSHDVYLYDKTNCTYKKFTFNISSTPPSLSGTSIINLTYCALPGEDGKWVNPCDYVTLPSDFMYTFEGYNSDIGYDAGGTHIDGCIAFYLHDGSHDLYLYDKTNCTYQKVTFNVSRINPTQVISTAVNLTYCAMDGEDGMWVNPCDYVWSMDPSTLFTFQDMVLPHSLDYNSENGYYDGGTHITGCIAFYLHDGSYQFNYYDKVNCTYNTIIFEINHTNPVTTVCQKYITLRCDQPDPDPELESATMDCVCNHDQGVESTGWFTEQYGDLPLTTAKVYKRRYFNRQSCTICELQIIVEHVYQEWISKSIHVTAHCPTTQSFNIRSLFAEFPNPIVGPIYHYETPVDLIPRLISGDEYEFCCPYPESGRHHIFEAMDANGCMYRVVIFIDCDEGPEFRIENTKVAGSGKDHPGEQSSRKGVTGSDGQENLTVSPNPSSGIYTIMYRCDDPSCTASQAYEISVTDLSGKVVYTRSDLKVNTSESFDLTQFASGVYTIRVAYGDTTQFIKLIKN